jgi:hypothetical protein
MPKKINGYIVIGRDGRIYGVYGNPTEAQNDFLWDLDSEGACKPIFYKAPSNKADQREEGLVM